MVDEVGVLYRGDGSLWRLVNGTSDVTGGLLSRQKVFRGVVAVGRGIVGETAENCICWVGKGQTIKHRQRRMLKKKEVGLTSEDGYEI